MEEPLRLIDLFSGCGGFTLGFTQLRTPEGDPIWANDFNEDSVASYNANFGDHCVHGNIVDLLKEGVEIPEAEIVIGGPPGQCYSLLNKDREADPRKQLWRPYMDVVEKVEAKVFVMENVPQLLGSADHDDIKKRAEELGFEVESAKLLAADYGVPQTRKRAFVIGSRVRNPAECFPPPRTHYNPENGQISIEDIGRADELKLSSTVQDAIGDLPPPLGTEIRDEDRPFDLHFSRNPTAKSIRRYIAVQEQGANRYDLEERAPEITPECWKQKDSGGTNIFGRLWWDRPALTIRMEFFKPEKGRTLYPDQHRAITHREAARFQSFPDWFEFAGSKRSIARQIGNAVPSRLGVHVAYSALRALDVDVPPVREVEVKASFDASCQRTGFSDMSEEEIEALCEKLKERIKELRVDLRKDEIRQTVRMLVDTDEANKRSRNLSFRRERPGENEFSSTGCRASAFCFAGCQEKHLETALNLSVFLFANEALKLIGGFCT